VGAYTHWDLFCPLVHVDFWPTSDPRQWGIFGQLATRANGHLGFGVFIATKPVFMTWKLTFTMHCSVEAPCSPKTN
jgi:hypothetical protein